MSQTGDVVRLQNGTFDIQATQDEITLTIDVVNDSSVDYPVQIPVSISQGADLLYNDTINSRISPNNTRRFNVNSSHSLDPGTNFTACASVEIDDENVGGL